MDASATLESRTRAHCKKYRANDSRALWELFVTVVAYAVVDCLITTLPPLLWIVLKAYVAVRTFVVFHDCCHEAFFTSRVWNKRVGTFLGAFVLTPYDHWRWTHNVNHHHVFGLYRDTRDSGQTLLFTKKTWEEMPFWKKCVSRVFRDPFVFVTATAMLHFYKYRLPFYKGWLFVDVFCAVYHAVFIWLGWQYWFYLNVATMLADGTGLFLFHLQHSVNPVYKVKEGEKRSGYEVAIKGSTHILVAWYLRFMTMGIQYHHIHHLDSKVPGYYLKECHEEAPPGMWDDVVRVDARRAFRAFFDTMYDETTGKAVSFPIYEWLLSSMSPK